MLDATHAITWGGWDPIVSAGGALLVMIVGTGLMIIAKRRRILWLGAFHFGMMHSEWIRVMFGSDFYRLKAGPWITFSIIFLVLSWVAVVKIKARPLTSSHKTKLANAKGGSHGIFS